MVNHGYLSLDDIEYGTAIGFKGVNCKHDWRPYYKGSTRTYTYEELEKMANEKVTYNGEKISRYEASQIQRKIERQIRQDKKDIAGLQGILTSNNTDNKLIEETKVNLINVQNKLKIHNSSLNDFIEQTKFRKDYSRLTIGKISTNSSNGSIISKNINKEVKNVQYVDITNNFTNIKQYQLEKQKYFISEEGTKYIVNGKQVKLEPSNEEIETAELLGKMYGGKIKLIPKVTLVDNVETPDYIVNNERFDRKGINGSSKTGIYNRIHSKQKQADNFVIDITNAKLTIDDYIKQAQDIYINKRTYWVNTLIITKNNQIIKCFKRK